VAYGGGAIAHQCTGNYSVKSAKAAFAGPGDGDLTSINMPQSSVPHDQQVRIVDLSTGVPMANQRYRATMEDGQVTEGKTDDKGLTQILKSAIPFGHFTIEAIYD
jgi:type VI secretion system secreted protein VgrG